MFGFIELNICMLKSTVTKVRHMVMMLLWLGHKQTDFQVLRKSLCFPRKYMGFVFSSHTFEVQQQQQLQRPVDFGRLSFQLEKSFSQNVVACSASAAFEPPPPRLPLGALFDSTQEIHLGFTHDFIRCARFSPNNLAIYF